MRYPFSLVNGLWTCRESHEVTFHNVLSMHIVEPQGLRPGEAIMKGEGVDGLHAGGVLH